jgi:hypothetical protein
MSASVSTNLKMAAPMLSFSPFLVEFPVPPADLEPEAAFDVPVLFEGVGALSPWIPKNVNFLLPAVIDAPIAVYFL